MMSLEMPVLVSVPLVHPRRRNLRIMASKVPPSQEAPFLTWRDPLITRNYCRKRKYKQMVHCYYCAMLLWQDNLKRHCLKEHSEQPRPLRDGETPAAPVYSNWEDWLANYPDVAPVRFRISK